MRKYELMDVKKQLQGRILHRIHALRDFGDVKKGDIGGWVEHEGNLSHEGECWIYGEACVFDVSTVKDDAQVFGTAWVKNQSIISGNAWVFGDSYILGYTQVSGNAWVSGKTKLGNRVVVNKDVWLTTDKRMFGVKLLFKKYINLKRFIRRTVVVSR